MDGQVGASLVNFIYFSRFMVEFCQLLLSSVWSQSGQIGSVADPSAPRTSPSAFGADFLRGDGNRKT